MEKKLGFTLVELLIVITIIGILMVVGYPSYQTYLRESRRQYGIQGLLTWQVAVENYIAQNNALPPTSWSPATGQYSTNGFYNLTYYQENTTLLTYHINAVAITGTTQVNDTAAGGSISCSTLTLTSTVSGITPAQCK